MSCGIYKIANKVTGDFYVGSAININNRFSNHRWGLKKGKHPNQILQNVFNKYGSDNLSFEIIESVKDKNKLIEKEQYFIDSLNPKYNICKIAGSNLGVKWSEESKLKRVGYKKGRKLSEKTKRKISKNNSKHWLGKTRSEETKKKISKTCKNKKLSEKTKLKISESLIGNTRALGYKHSEETKLKMSRSSGKPFKIKSPEGQIISDINLFKFCKENKLNDGHMGQVIKGKLNHHKGWTKA